MLTTTEAGARPPALVSFPRAPAALCSRPGDHAPQAQPVRRLDSGFLRSDLHDAKKTPPCAAEIPLRVPSGRHARAETRLPPVLCSATLRKAPSPQPTVGIQSQEVVYLCSVLTSRKRRRSDDGVTGPGRPCGGWGPSGGGGTWGLGQGPFAQGCGVLSSAPAGVSRATSAGPLWTAGRARLLSASQAPVHLR